MNPSVIYDIGANDGSWTRGAKQVFPNAHYEQFEANQQHQAPGRHMVLLGDAEKEVPFFKAVGASAGANTGASIYLEVTHHYTPGKYTSETLRMVPLDVYAVRNNLPQPDLLKLDVQGAELDVLRGAQTILRNTRYVLMEAALHRWNKDAPMIEEIVAFMASNGFELVDIVDHHVTEGYLFQVDLLFARGLRKQSFYQ